MRKRAVPLGEAEATQTGQYPDTPIPQHPRLDLDAVRVKLAGKQGRTYWRSLEEVAETDEFQAWMEDEFPHRATLLQMNRRTLLKFMGASMALAGLSGCRSVFMDEEKIVPYVRQPEEIVPGKPLYFATAAPAMGYGVGVLVESREGRPLKIEGNPDHPDSQGSTTAMLQAEILNFYDPDRAQAVLNQGEISTWDMFFEAATKMLADQKAKGGAGIRILTETISSPLLYDQLRAFLAKYPRAKCYQYDPCGRDSAKVAAVRAFGRPVETIYDLKKAKVIVSLDSDFLFEGPGCLRYARDFADGRRVMGDRTDMNRLYAIESWPTITGATADHRFPVRGSDIEKVAMALANAVGIMNDRGGPASGITSDNIAAIARDLIANKGAAVVIPGQHQSPLVHAMCHAINNAIGALGTTALLTPTMDDSPMTQVDGLKELTADLNSKQVDALFIIGGNPVYNAPVDFEFGNALKNCPLAVHHGLRADETSDLCAWHLPLTHFLEQWGDVRAYDGTVSLIQPLIAPLFDSRSAHQLMGSLMGGETDGYKILYSGYKAKSASIPAFKDDFEKGFRRALNDGIIAKTAYAPLALPLNTASLGAFTPRPISGTELIIRSDPTIGDGRFSNNGWLQELAKPLTKTTWENCIFMSPAMGQQLGLTSEDGAEIVVKSQSVQGPVWVMPGHPDNAITVHLGYGRTKAGAVGDGIGFNAYTLRHSDAMSFGVVERINPTGAQSMAVASTQIHHTMEGRDIVRLGNIEDYKKNPALYVENENVHVNQTHPDHQIENENLYPDQIFDYNGPQWGMTVDLNTCIGCNACVVACQAENNIPVVGKDQVKRGREMQWIRIDRYYANAPSSQAWGAQRDHPDEGIKWDVGDFQDDPIANPDMVFQPVMCQQCEKAPCEPVCPVGATTHSHEGLNQMVYNRCVGTRYCSNNCPYKVRRFNYLNYTDNQAQFDAHDEENRMRVPLLKLLNNPDVTVRGRGVMEKCTFCVQRINSVRVEGKKQGRDPKDGEILTACQEACPTKTIVFGNVADKDSHVSQIRSDKRAYQLLREVQTRPRVSYLGKIRNTNPEIKAQA